MCPRRLLVTRPSKHAAFAGVVLRLSEIFDAVGRDIHCRSHCRIDPAPLDIGSKLMSEPDVKPAIYHPVLRCAANHGGAVPDYLAGNLELTTNVDSHGGASADQ